MRATSRPATSLRHSDGPEAPGLTASAMRSASNSLARRSTAVYAVKYGAYQSKKRLNSDWAQWFLWSSSSISPYQVVCTRAIHAPKRPCARDT